MKEQDPGVKWFNTSFYPQRNTGRAVRYEDGVLPRLREQTVTLFTPWGPRYKWETRGVDIKKGDKEFDVLNFLSALRNELVQNMPKKNFRWIFLGADLYGTRINNLPSDIVDRYFTGLVECLAWILPTAEFKLWSEFDDDAEKYRQNIRRNLSDFVDDNLLFRANQTARTMERKGNPQEYLVERLAEAMLIEETFRPIKVSCVGRHKDDKVDWELPRLYFLPELLQAPWM